MDCDYDNDNQFAKWQKQLDDAGIDYDVTNLCGCTFKQIDGYVNMLIRSVENG